MPRQDLSSARREGGTASVELIATVPFLLLAVLVAAQIAIAGHALWASAVAARAGARAELVGRSPVAAARLALPTAMRDGAEVAAAESVAVRVIVPRLLPALPRLAVESETALGGMGG